MKNVAHDRNYCKLYFSDTVIRCSLAPSPTVASAGVVSIAWRMTALQREGSAVATAVAVTLVPRPQESWTGDPVWDTSVRLQPSNLFSPRSPPPPLLSQAHHQEANPWTGMSRCRQISLWRLHCQLRSQQNSSSPHLKEHQSQKRSSSVNSATDNSQNHTIF